MDKEHARFIEIFYSYSHKDEELRDELANHLGNDHVTWHDRNITAGAEWLLEINRNLDSADIILLLISANYLSSVPCNEEMDRALARRSRGEVIVIPVILRFVAPKLLTPFSDFQFLPTDGKPVESIYWPHRDEAFANIATGIHQKIEEILRKADFFVRKGDTLSKQGSYQEAIYAYEKALEISPENVSLYEKKGNLLYELRKYLEAARAFHQLIEHEDKEDKKVQFLRYKARALTKAQDLREAYITTVEAIQLIKEDSYLYPYLYKELGDVLVELKEMPQAIAAYTKAIQHDENFVLAYRARIRTCEKLIQDDQEKAK